MIALPYFVSGVIRTLLEPALSSRALPVSQKLGLFLSTAVLLVVSTMAISAYGYVNIDASLSSAKVGKIEQEFIVGMMFIMGIIITLTIRVIVSWSTNLQTMFETQIDMLKNVQEGALDKHVPVLTQDEFGIIAQQTNLIIDQLRKRLGYRIVTSADVHAKIPECHKAIFHDPGKHQIRGKAQPVHLQGPCRKVKSSTAKIF